MGVIGGLTRYNEFMNDIMSEFPEGPEVTYLDQNNIQEGEAERNQDGQITIEENEISTNNQ